MASVDKVKIGDTTYDVSPSKDGTLNGYTSGDAASPSGWSSVSAISSSDTNATIFNKLTTMVKNVRWLYAKLGNTDFSATGSDTVSGALVSLKTSLDGKADSDHSHTVADLPVTSNQSDSTSTIPTCALLYSMNQELDALEEAANNIISVIDNPNKRTYSPRDLGTIASIQDADTFFDRFKNSNNYAYGNIKLALGDYITIQDGTYNVQWVIAGFDMEHNQTAADGTVYDNGLGICLIPKTQVTTGKWNTSNTTTGGYKSSHMHTTVLPGIVNTLKTVLGDHIVNRNVLLSNTVTSGSSSAYTWTTADAALISIGQMIGRFGSHDSKYDDGEANYKLPLFNYENYNIGSTFWSRGVDSGSRAWCVDSSGSVSYSSANLAFGVRPLIYLRLDATNMIMPNGRYAPRDLGTWSSINQVTKFLSKYTHDNGYYDSESDTMLGLGDYVTIQDGTYNVQWEIAGFDMEYNQTAADGTTYNNGYGICLIPKTQITTGQWNTSNTTSGGYKSSYMHNTVLPGIVTTLKNVLGNHIANRNVLLSSTVTSGKSSAYTWTTADATLMSGYQLTGTAAAYSNKYDDGEANYKLPVFNYEAFKTGSGFWLRGVYDIYDARYVYDDGNISFNDAVRTTGVRPLIYLR